MKPLKLTKILIILISISFCNTFLLAEETKTKITQYEINETLDMLGGKEKFMKDVEKYSEKRYYLANQIILWERSPKVERYSDLDNKKMILDLEVINQRINKETYAKNMITFNEYNIEFIGTKEEINHFLTELLFDKQENYYFENILMFKKNKDKTFDIKKDIIFDNEAFVKYRIHMIKQEENENKSHFKLFVNMH